VRQLIEKQIEWKREYDVLLSIHGTSVKGSVDRQPVIELSIGEDLSGTIALATYGPHAIARFREPRIRTSVEVK
jgi:hypothetical protein